MTVVPAPNSLTISWASPAGVKYRVKYGTTTSLGTQTVWTTSTSVTLGGLNPSTTYYFKIVAVDSLNQSVTSVAYTTITPAHFVSLNWSDPDPTVVSYNLYRTDQSCTGLLAIITGITNTSADDHTGVISGTTYCYAVTAIDGNNVESGFSNTVLATIPVP